MIEPAAFIDVQIESTGRPAVTGTISHRAGHVIPHEDGGRDGVFASWHWDGMTLTVENDPFGIHPLFYYAVPGRICVSTSIAQLAALGVPLELDAGVLGVFMRLDMLLGEDTCFQGIKTLPANSVLSWRDGTISMRGGRLRASPSSLSRADALANYADLFTRAVRRRLPRADAFAVPLSGGQDSRHILFELVSLGCRPQDCVTTRHYPPRSDEDARIAGLITEALGVNGVILEPGKDRVGDQLVCDRICNYATAGMNMLKAVADYIQPRASVIYDGLGGDILSAAARSSPARLALLRAGAYDKLFKELAVSGEDALRCLVSPALLARMPLDDAISRFTSDLRRHLDAPNPWASFLLHSRVRRTLAQSPFALMANAGTVFVPYLDRELACFLLSLAPEVTIDGNFHRDTIRLTYTQYADLPFEDRSQPEKPGGPHYRAWSRAFAAAWLREPRHAFLNSWFLVPRLGLSMLSSRHAMKQNWFARWAVYLFGLERFIKESRYRR